MKKLTKLIALLTAAVLSVPSLAVSAEDLPDTEQTEHTEEYYKYLENIYFKIADFIGHNVEDSHTFIEEDGIHIELYDYHTSEEGMKAVKAFIEENGIDTSIIHINANILDPAVKEAADRINDFIAENYLLAYARIFNNTLDEVTVEIDDWREEKKIAETIKGFMKENDIDESKVTFLAWGRKDENGVLRGDVDEDGELTYEDLQILEELVGKYSGDTLPDVADFNGDGRADTDDAAEFECYLCKIERINPGSLEKLECSYTRSGFSEISVSGGKAVCKSLIYGYSYVKRITVEQTLQKANANGMWENVKTWKKTFNDYKAALKNNAPKLSAGFYRLKTRSVVYSGNSSETVTKYSRKYAVGISSDTGDANGDGKVNVRDCAYIAKMLAKGKSLPAKADYNLDGKKNVRDAAALANDIAHFQG